NSSTFLSFFSSLFFFLFFFFFSSRRRHTRLQGDWSSDVCSSDLESTISARFVGLVWANRVSQVAVAAVLAAFTCLGSLRLLRARSEERRVGKECRSRWGPYQ